MLAVALMTALAAVTAHGAVARSRPTLSLAAPGLISLRGVPLSQPTPVDLELTRSWVFASHARIDVVGRRGRVRVLPVPREKTFVGRTTGDPASWAAVIVGRSTLRGVVATRGRVFRLVSRAGGLVTEELALAAGAPLGCGADGDRAASGGASDTRLVPLEAGSPVQADLAIDTDHELWAVFERDVPAVNLIVDLVAATNAVYQRETGVHFRIGYLRLWRTPADPWTANTAETQLYELRRHWLDPASALGSVGGAMDTIHLVSGRGIVRSDDHFGGIAFVDTLCSPNRFGLTRAAPWGQLNVAGAILTLAHELGHTMGSPHTHCYEPPIDRCWARESGPRCYRGPEEQVTGTIMSYCSARDLTFHERTQDRIRSGASAARCLAPICPDGADAGACDDLDPCTEDTCDPVAGCAHARITGCCRDPLCDDDDPCTSDRCDDQQGCVHQTIPECCTAEEQCEDGDVCTRDTCNATRQRCEYPLWDHVREACDDGNTCTRDCTNDGDNRVRCIREPLPGCCISDGGCDDANPCTSDRCDAEHHCVSTAAPDAPGCCIEDGECDDANPCTVDRCDAQFRCTFPPATDGTSCVDAACANGQEACTGGTCTAGLPPPGGMDGVRCGLADIHAIAASDGIPNRLRRKLRPLRAAVAARLVALERASGATQRGARARRRLAGALRALGAAVEGAAKRRQPSPEARDAFRLALRLCADRVATWDGAKGSTAR